MQVIVRDVGIFNDTLMTELIEDLGQLRETDIVMVNWGAWYPRFQYGYTEVCCSVACTTTPWSTMCCVMRKSHSWRTQIYFVSASPAAAAVVDGSVGAVFSVNLMDRAAQKICVALLLHTPKVWQCTGDTALPSNDSLLLYKAVHNAWVNGLILK